MAKVTLDRLRKVYPNGFVGVDDASFEIADGELLVLVGPSGCGKSTLLRMIAGLETDQQRRRCASASAWSTSVAPKDRDIAMVFQSYALYPHMSVAENLGFGLKLRGAGKAEIDRARARGRGDARAGVAARAQAGARCPAASASASRSAGRWCGNRRCSCSTNRCPTSTPSCAHPMRVEIARLHRQLGTTMIYVTHDQIEAMTLGQRIVVLDRGRDPADRHADGVVQPAGEPVRGDVPRQPDDEPAVGRGGAKPTA